MNTLLQYPVQLAFIIGFLSGILFVALYGRTKPFLQSLTLSIHLSLRDLRRKLSSDPRLTYFNDLLPFLQHQHIAHTLFSLDEILIPPRLLAPPPRVDPDQENIYSHYYHELLPYIPDFPDIGSALGAPTFTLAESLALGARILLLGQPGSGKTVALAHLAAQIARRSVATKNINQYTPFYMHASEIDFRTKVDHNPEDVLLPPIEKTLDGKATRKLKSIYSRALSNGTALLLVDGLDELNQGSIDFVCVLLQQIIEKYPDNLFIIACSMDYYGQLLDMDFLPHSISMWNHSQKKAFTEKWHTLWTTHISPALWDQQNNSEDEYILFANWQHSGDSSNLPLEICLNTWGAYAGDLTGMTSSHGIKAYVERFSKTNMNSASNPANITGLERLALRLLLHQNAYIEENEARNWFSKPLDKKHKKNGELQLISLPDPLPATKEKEGTITVRSQGVGDMVETGLLIPRNNNRIMFSHLVIAGFLAGNALAYADGATTIANQVNWAFRSSALQYLAANRDITPLVDLIQKYQNPIQSNLFVIGRWLSKSGILNQQQMTVHPWKIAVMRQLVALLQSADAAPALRARAMVCLANSHDPSVPAFFRKILQDPDPVTRRLAALGSGYLCDEASVETLSKMIFDPHHEIQWASVIALAFIANEPAMDAVATALLQGNEELQHVVAEALAHLPEEGHKMLEEASQLEEVSIRRASVFGLALVNEPWAIRILENMRLHDPQWVVKNAASHALDQRDAGSPLIQSTPSRLHETPWLILFAGEQGQGITPGKAARDMIHMAMLQGQTEQRLAALHLLQLYAREDTISDLYRIVLHEKGDILDAAVLVLVYLLGKGVHLPSHLKFGYL